MIDLKPLPKLFEILKLENDIFVFEITCMN